MTRVSGAQFKELLKELQVRGRSSRIHQQVTLGGPPNRRIEIADQSSLQFNEDNRESKPMPVSGTSPNMGESFDIRFEKESG